jgi:hypothetical protein
MSMNLRALSAIPALKFLMEPCLREGKWHASSEQQKAQH